MDSVFGVGLPELVVIVVIAGMVMGPERIAQTARKLGRLTAQLQGVSRAFFRQLNAELDAVDEGGDIKATVEELRRLRQQVDDLRGEIFTLASGTAGDTRQVVRDIKREARNSIMPPDLVGRAQRPLAPAVDDEVYAPPLLFDNASSPVARAAASAPGRLPNRVAVVDDPDE